MKKKYYVFACACMMLTSFYIWRKPLSFSFAKVGLNTIAQKTLGESFTFKKIEWERGRITLVEPRLGSESKLLKEEGLFIEAPKASLFYHINWLHKKLELRIEIPNSSVKLYRSEKTYESLKKVFKSRSKILDVKTYLTLDQGQLILIAPSQVKILDFNFEKKELNSDQEITHITLYDGSSYLKGIIHQIKETYDCKIDFDRIKLRSLKELINFGLKISGKREFDQVDLEGVLSGSLDLVLLEGYLPLIHSKLEIQQLDIQAQRERYSTKVPKLSITFETPNRIDDQPSLNWERKIFHLLEQSEGFISLPIYSEFTLSEQNKELLKGQNFKGKMMFSHRGPSKLNLDGTIRFSDQLSHIALEGQGSFLAQRGDMQIRLNHELGEEANLNLSIDPQPEGIRKVSATFDEFKKSEVQLLKELIAPVFPEVQKIELAGGNIAAKLHLYLNQHRIEKVVADHFFLHELKGKYLGLASVENLNAEGNFLIYLDQKIPLQSFSGDIWFEADSICYDSQKVTQLKGSFAVDSGHLRSSKIEALFSGLQTSFLCNRAENSLPLFLEFKGQGKDFLDFIPEGISQYYREIFAQCGVEVQFKGDLQKEGLLLTGFCEIEKKDYFDFGFYLKKMGNLKKHSNSSLQKLNWFSSYTQILPTMTQMSKQKIRKFEVENGWFRSKNVPIQNYLTPLIFKNTAITCRGSADLEGTFNSNTLVLKYQNYDFVLDHSDVQISSKSYRELEGVHYFDLAHGNHFGNIPLHFTQAEIKGCDLLFSDLSGLIHLTSGSIFCPQLKGSCKEIDIVTKLDMKFLGDGAFLLKLNQPEMKGSFSKFQKLVHVFGNSLLDTLPLEGQVQVDSKEAYFSLLKREGYDSKLKLKGKFFEGETHFDNFLDLHALNSDFHYDSKAGTFEIENLSGKWKDIRDKIFDVESHYFKLDLNSIEPKPFDFRVKDRFIDHARLKGSLSLSSTSHLPSFKVLLNSSVNHVGNIWLNKANLTLSKKIEYLHVDFTTDLKYTHQNLKLLYPLPLSLSSLDTEFNKLKFQGKVSGQWIYSQPEKKHQFFVWGDQVKCGEKISSPLQLRGHSQNGFITLDDFQYNHFNGTLKLEEKPFWYVLHELQLGKEDLFLLELSGTYCKIFNTIQADILKLSCNLENLQKQIFGLPDLSGSVDFGGKVRGGFFRKGWSFKGDISAKGSQLKVKDFYFSETPIELQIKVNPQGVIFSQLTACLKEFGGRACPISFKVNDFNWKKDFSESSLNSLEFNLPKPAFDNLKLILEEKFNLPFLSKFSEVKLKSDLQGRVSYLPFSNSYFLNIELDKNEYRFKNKNYPLEDLAFKYGNKGLFIGLKTHFEVQPYWIHLKREKGLSNLISCELFERDPNLEFERDNPHITVKFQGREEKLPLFQSLHGTLSGVKWDFVHRPEKDLMNRKVFMGQIQVKNREYLQKLPSVIKPFFSKFGLGEGYFLSGQLILNPDNWFDFLFEGLLGGRDISLFGYEFKSLSSSIFFSSKRCLIRDLKISDLSGEGSIPEIKLEKVKEKYIFELPKMRLKNFKPSLLRVKGQDFLNHKPLIIEYFELNDLKGELTQPKSFKGSGSLKFLKSPKKQSSLLDIPGHLLSKIGLDLTMLNPVEGKILYEIKNEKIELTKFVDVYSHDRNCHFQLAKSPLGSYIDFNGNLNIKIKMKQYVLLKLTEPFIISIEGDMMNPKYSFRRKKLKVDVPQKANH